MIAKGEMAFFLPSGDCCLARLLRLSELELRRGALPAPDRACCCCCMKKLVATRCGESATIDGFKCCWCCMRTAAAAAWYEDTGEPAGCCALARKRLEPGDIKLIR